MLKFPSKIISLDIGSCNTKIVIGKYSKDKVYIDKNIMIKTPVHTVDDGNLIDKRRLSAELENVLRINNIKLKDVNCTTNSTSIINREIVIPKAEDSELDTMIKFEIQQYLPIIMEDYIVQYNVLDTVKNDDSENALDKLRVLVVAYPKNMAEAYLNLLQDAKLKPCALDVNFNSINKLLRSECDINGKPYSTEETVAVIDMGAESINVDILSKGNMNFSRMITSGGNAIDKHIALKKDITLMDAEKMKIQYCDLSGENSIEHMEELNSIIKDDVNKWMEEINRIIHYYKNKNVGNRIEKVYIHGGSSKLNGIEKYMERGLNLPLVKIKSTSNVVLGKGEDGADFEHYLNAAGSIIRL